mmetsp:Transcript_108574/g.184004  ORF Transcript_108574/g.184004 Transcript_108574/m.184004 type:complete len:84 (-) Transcript_108574:7-258(-)
MRRQREGVGTQAPGGGLWRLVEPGDLEVTDGSRRVTDGGWKVNGGGKKNAAPLKAPLMSTGAVGRRQPPLLFWVRPWQAGKAL